MSLFKLEPSLGSVPHESLACRRLWAKLFAILLMDCYCCIRCVWDSIVQSINMILQNFAVCGVGKWKCLHFVKYLPLVFDYAFWLCVVCWVIYVPGFSVVAKGGAGRENITALVEIRHRVINVNANYIRLFNTTSLFFIFLTRLLNLTH